MTLLKRFNIISIEDKNKTNGGIKMKPITIIESKCPECNHRNPQKTIMVENIFNVEEIESAKRMAMMCDNCACDVYTYGQENFDSL